MAEGYIWVKIAMRRSMAPKEASQRDEKRSNKQNNKRKERKDTKTL